MSDASAYRAVTLEEIGFTGGIVPVDIYIRVPTANVYTLLVSAGEKATDQRLNDLKMLSGTNLYVMSEAKLKQAVDGLAKIGPNEVFKGDILGEQAGSALKTVYTELMQIPADAAKPSNLTIQLIKMSDAVLNLIAPEVNEPKILVLKHLQNLHVMNQSAAITAIATLCLLANDYKSRSSFQAVSFASMLMDASLVEFTPEQVDQYHKNRNELPRYVMDRMRFHAVKSQQIVDRLPVMTDTIRQLILSHHELYNGQGYHRALKGQQISPLASVLALAVDLYEGIKGAELNGKPISLREAILNLEEWGTDARERRHANRLISSLMAFLGIEPAAAVRWTS